MKMILKLNIFNLVMILTLALTWPNFNDGFIKGIVIAVKINIFYIFFAKFHDEIFDALMNLRLPDKFRILMILTFRGIFILKDRIDTVLTSLKLRAPNLHGIMKFKTFAYVIGSIILQSLRRSENISRAVKCRGGFNGFNQTRHSKFRKNDLILYTYIFVVLLLGYA